MINWIKNNIFTKTIPYDILICMAWGLSLWGFVRGIITKLPIIHNYPFEIEGATFLLLFIISLPIILKNIRIYDILFVFFFLITYAINFFLFEKNTYALTHNALNCLVLALPFYIFGAAVDIKKYFTAFSAISCLSILGIAFYFLSYAQNKAHAVEDMVSGYSMSRAYEILPHVLFVIWSTIKEFRLYKLFFAVLGLFMIISFGTRGPLACVAFYFAVYFFLFAEFKHAKWIKTIAAGLSLVGVVFIQDIARWLYIIMSDANMSVRIMERIISGQFNNDSGRGFIQAKLWSILESNHSFFGYGFFGSTEFGIIYPHNLITDIYFTFGYAIGTALTIITGFLILYAFLIGRKEDREFLLLLSTVGIIKLFMSNSFLLEPMSFALLAYTFKTVASHSLYSKTYLHKLTRTI